MSDEIQTPESYSIDYLPHDLRKLAARIENEDCELVDVHHEAVIGDTQTITLECEVEFDG